VWEQALRGNSLLRDSSFTNRYTEYFLKGVIYIFLTAATKPVIFTGLAVIFTTF
jgi:hypothetical protein